MSTLVLGAEGSSLNPIQASENIVILETNVCTSSVHNLLRRLGFLKSKTSCSGLQIYPLKGRFANMMQKQLHQAALEKGKTASA